MTLSKRVLLAATSAAAIAVAGLAQAADLPSMKEAPPPPPAPLFSWTGFYVGGQAGYAFGTDRSYDLLAANGVGLGPPTSALPGSFSSSGPLGGGEIGANYQTGNIVLGVEADIDWSRIQGSYIDDPSSAPSGQSTVTATADWFGTVRARLGLTQDRWLAFATGGFAYGGTRVGISNYTGTASPYLTDHQTLVGWTAGGGVEYALTNNWTVKAEYLFVDLGGKTFTFSDPANTCGCALPPSFVVAESKGAAEFSVLRLGVNYKF